MSSSSLLAIIPARGGSKGIPGKNIKSFCSHPLISWSLAAAKAASPPILRTIVSTDCPKIARIAKQYGGDVPFLRPTELAADETPTIEVLKHALDQIDPDKSKYKWILTLQPTSPLRTADDIQSAFRLAAETNCDSVVSVVDETNRHPSAAKTIIEGRLSMMLGEPYTSVRRQDQPKTYFNNGAIYITRTTTIYENNSMYGEVSLPYIMPKRSSFDIDDPIDWEICEFLFDNR